MGAVVAQAVEPCGLTLPAAHLSKLPGGPTCPRFGDSDPLSFGERPFREGVFSPPTCRRQEGKGLRSDLPRVQDAAYPRLPAHPPGAFRGRMDRPAGPSTKAEPLNSRWPGDGPPGNAGHFQLEGGDTHLW